jgi:ferredoxin-like protein FixX
VSKISDLVQLLKDPKEGLVRRTRKLKKQEYKKAFVGIRMRPLKNQSIHVNAHVCVVCVVCRVAVCSQGRRQWSGW